MHALSGAKVAGLSAARGYDAIAASYDDQVRGDDWMRSALQTHYLRVFRPGQRVLDVGCGTGTDAIALALHGIQVVGIDGSAGMVDRLRLKVKANGLANLVQARVMDVQDLSCLSDGPFDGLISAFAGLSAVPELARFAADAARLVRPGGRVVLHLLNRFSVWEWLGYLLHHDWSAASEVGRLTTRTFVIGGQRVQHWLYFAEEAYQRFFSTAFEWRAGYGLGSLRPPHTVRRIPSALVLGLEWLDVRVGGLALLRDASRFFVLDLERRST